MGNSEESQRLEIGHVLFLDIVGYSKLLNEDQKERLNTLTDIVRATTQVGKSTDEELVRLPTGDGMALVFRDSVEEAARCAMEIAPALRDHPELPVRMGIHSGPVSDVTDVAGRTNISGAGINMAQRVMDCGDAGHILLSKRAAEDLSQLRQWREHLHDLGESEVKHGVRVALVNLYTDEIGNHRLPAKLAAGKRRRAMRRGSLASGVVLLAILIAAAILYSLGRRSPPSVAAGRSVSLADKSVAVLPFENLSRDPDNAFFADGVQDEILTDLAKVADLKVISRTSVMQYKTGLARNLREIGQQLGVAHLLEGSVQRAGNKVRVNAQLINATTDAHEWAENYDRPLDDVFAIQSEIAKAIADQLQAKIAPSQLADIERKPTNDLQAYDAYLRGTAYLEGTAFYAPKNTAAAIQSLREATRLDPSFTNAWASLARALLLNFFNDPTANRATLEAGREAADKAYELQPNSVQANLAQGYRFYFGERDYEEATRWFEKALKLAPNNSATLQALASVARRTGKWQESVAYYRRAVELNPRDVAILESQWEVLFGVRDYAGALRVCDALLKITPDSKSALASKVDVFQAVGDLKKAAALLPSQPGSDLNLFASQVTQWSYERRYQEAVAAVTAALSSQGSDVAGAPVLLASLAFVRHMSGDLDGSREAALRLQTVIKQQGTGVDYAFLQNYAEALALSGDKEGALTYARRLEKEKDHYFSVGFPYLMAEIGVLFHDRETALRYLDLAARTPSGLNYGEMKFSPLWDELHSDSRFAQILVSLQPPPLP